MRSWVRRLRPPGAAATTVAARRKRSGTGSRRGRESSIGPDGSPTTPTPALQAQWLARNAVDCLPEGGLEQQARAGPSAARQARHRPDRARHPPRVHRRAPEAARVPGSRPHGRADHRRLHRHAWATRADARAPGRCSSRPRSTPTPAPSRSRRSRCSTEQRLEVALQRRVAGHVDGSSCSGCCARRRSRSCSNATTSPSASRLTSRSRCSSSCIRCFRGMTRSRSRRTSSSGGPTRSSTCCSGATSSAHYGQPEQVILTVPLLTGTDGVRKMSKSFDNYIGVTEPPEEMYGKTMSIPDGAIESWYTLLLGREPPAGAGSAGRQARACPRVGRRASTAPARAAEAERAIRSGPHPARAARRGAGRRVRRLGRRGPSAGAAGAGVRHLDIRGAAQPRPGRASASTAGRSPTARSTCDGGRGGRQGAPAGQAPVRRGFVSPRPRAGEPGSTMAVHGGLLRLETPGQRRRSSTSRRASPACCKPPRSSAGS